MSTILKALRRLEDDKVAQRSVSLEESVTPPAEAMRASRRGSLLIGVTSGVGVVLLALTAFLLLRPSGGPSGPAPVAGAPPTAPPGLVESALGGTAGPPARETTPAVAPVVMKETVPATAAAVLPDRVAAAEPAAARSVPAAPDAANAVVEASVATAPRPEPSVVADARPTERARAVQVGVAPVKVLPVEVAEVVEVVEVVPVEVAPVAVAPVEVAPVEVARVEEAAAAAERATADRAVDAAREEATAPRGEETAPAPPERVASGSAYPLAGSEARLEELPLGAPERAMRPIGDLAARPPAETFEPRERYEPPAHETAPSAELEAVPEVHARAPDVETLPSAKPDASRLIVTQTVWHPNASRRVAYVELDDGSSKQIGEGDFFAGYAVEKIGLASVEFRRGETKIERRVGAR